MFYVCENGRPADKTGFPNLKGHGWETSRFKTATEAMAYARLWLGPQFSGIPLPLDTIIDYDGYGDYIEIREEHSTSTEGDKMVPYCKRMTNTDGNYIQVVETGQGESTLIFYNAQLNIKRELSLSMFGTLALQSMLDEIVQKALQDDVTLATNPEEIE